MVRTSCNLKDLCACPIEQSTFSVGARAPLFARLVLLVSYTASSRDFLTGAPRGLEARRMHGFYVVG